MLINIFIKFILAFLFFNIHPIYGQDLPWPVDYLHYISSSFGEPRPERFHLGVDFKTGMITGKKVYSLGDGYISRITTSPYGYGKMLAITLDNGDTVIYGHLSSFLPEIEEKLYHLRKQNKTYDIEFLPSINEFRVQKGQVIAWSGDTGSGPAHLHVEIHDSTGNYINLLGYGVKVRDTIPPAIKSIILIPLAHSSLVNGLPLPLTIERGVLQPVTLTGEIGVVAQTWDMTDGSENILGNYRMSLYADSLMVFSKTYDIINKTDNGFGCLDYINGKNYGCQGVLSALFRRTGNLSGFYNNDGILDSNAHEFSGANSILLRAQDFSGNTSEIKIPVKFRNPPSINYCGYDGGEKIRIEGENPGGKDSFLELFKLNDKDKWKIQERISFKGQKFNLNTNLPKEKSTFKFVVTSEDSIQSVPHILSFNPSNIIKKNSPFEISTDMVHYGYLIRIKSKIPLSSTPLLEISDNSVPPDKKTLYCVPENDHAWISSLKISSPPENEITIKVKAFDSSLNIVSSEKTVEFGFLMPFCNSFAVSEDNLLNIYSPPDALFRSTPIEIKNVEIKTSENLKQITDGYSILLGDLPLRKNIRVNLEAGDLKSERIALYYSSSDKGPWSYLSGENIDGIFTGYIRGSCVIAAFEDTIPPVIKPVYLSDGSTVSDSVYIKAYLFDKGSGFAGSSAFRMIFDSEEVYGEYDYEADTLTWKPLTSISSGRHEIVIIARDRAGNSSECKWTFNYEPKK